MINKRTGRLRCLRWIIPGAIFFLSYSANIFSSDEISTLIRQGNEAFDRKDFDRMAFLGKRILAIDPHNTDGHRLIIFSFIKTERLSEIIQAFNKAIEQGGSAVELKMLEATLVYNAGFPQSSIEFLAHFEEKWQEKYGQRH